MNKPKKTFGYEMPNGDFVKREEALAWIRRQALNSLLGEIDKLDIDTILDTIADRGAQVVKAFQDAEKELD